MNNNMIVIASCCTLSVFLHCLSVLLWSALNLQKPQYCSNALLSSLVLLGHIACMECKVVAFCYICSMICVRLSVCLSVFLSVSSTKAAELIEMPFWFWTRMGPRNSVLCGGLDPRSKMAILWGCSPIRWLDSRVVSMLDLGTVGP